MHPYNLFVRNNLIILLQENRRQSVVQISRERISLQRFEWEDNRNWWRLLNLSKMIKVAQPRKTFRRCLWRHGHCTCKVLKLQWSRILLTCKLIKSSFSYRKIWRWKSCLEKQKNRLHARKRWWILTSLIK